MQLARSAAIHPGCCGMPQQAPATSRVRSCSCSSIRTVTVGPGFSPDQPARVAAAAMGPAACNLPGSRTSPCRFLQRFDVTASEGFHLALNRYLGWQYRSAFCSSQGDTFHDLVHFPGGRARNSPQNRRFSAKNGRHLALCRLSKPLRSPGYSRQALQFVSSPNSRLCSSPSSASRAWSRRLFMPERN